LCCPERAIAPAVILPPFKAGNPFKNQLYIRIVSTKEILLEVAEKLPPDATLVDAIYELEFRQAVEEGLASLDRGARIPLEEARKRIPQWISKYSSPTTH
jgi:predicted transcriptional regulator